MQAYFITSEGRVDGTLDHYYDDNTFCSFCTYDIEPLDNLYSHAIDREDDGLYEILCQYKNNNWWISIELNDPHDGYPEYMIKFN